MATTTNYSWNTPDNTAYVKDGASAIRTLGSSVDTTLFTALGGAYPGLRLIKKQVVGNAVSSVSVTGAFSATYDNYKIIYSGGVGSADGDLRLTLGSNAANYYMAFGYVAYAGGTASVSVNNGTSWQYAGSHRSTTNSLSCELFNPFASDQTIINATYVGALAGSVAGTAAGFLNDSASYTAFTLTPGSGSITGGTIYVYGYGAS
jgi:hypothetical protein